MLKLYDNVGAVSMVSVSVNAFARLTAAVGLILPLPTMRRPSGLFVAVRVNNHVYVQYTERPSRT